MGIMRLAAVEGRSVFGRRFDEGLGFRADVGLAAARQTTDRPNGHVVFAQNLAREPDTGRLFTCQRGRLSLGEQRRLTCDELDPTRRATRATAAAMQLIDARILLEREHQTLVERDFEGTDIHNGQYRHEVILFKNSLP